MGAGQENKERGQNIGAGNEEHRRNQEMGAPNRDESQRNNQRSEEYKARGDQRTEGTGERSRERAGVKHEGTREQRGQVPRNNHPGRAQSNEGIGPRNEGMGQRSEQGSGGFESARSVRLSTQQRTKIRDTFIHERVARVEHPNFALRVGTTIPRDVQVYDVPEDIVTVVPEYRGLKYIIVRNEVIFLDPDTLEIVAIMPA